MYTQLTKATTQELETLATTLLGIYQRTGIGQNLIHLSRVETELATRDSK
tara:strand:+ start:178 stop:327 length:150 start_codon:yes stop_codon:yes gene_type:complete